MITRRKRNLTEVCDTTREGFMIDSSINEDILYGEMYEEAN